MTLDLTAVRDQFRRHAGVPAQEIYSDAVVGKSLEGELVVYPMTALSDTQFEFGPGEVADPEIVNLSHEAEEDLLWVSATRRLEKVALAGRVRVAGHQRRSSTGNVTHVNSYWRSASSMGDDELDRAIVSMLTEGSMLNSQGRNRLQSLRNERRVRDLARRVDEVGPRSRTGPGTLHPEDEARLRREGYLPGRQGTGSFGRGAGSGAQFNPVARTPNVRNPDDYAPVVDAEGSHNLLPETVARLKARHDRQQRDHWGADPRLSPEQRPLASPAPRPADVAPGMHSPLSRLRATSINGEVSATSVAEFIKANPQYTFLDVLRLLESDGLRIRGWVAAPTAALSRLLAQVDEEAFVKHQVLALAAAETEDPEFLALAGRVRVESHKRTTKSGKSVDVEAHFRSPQSMKPDELVEALKALRTAPSTTPLENNRNRNQRRAIVSEMRRRGVKVPTAPDLPGKNGRLKQPDVETARKKVEGGAHPEVAVNELAEKASMDPKEKSAVRNALPKAKDDMDVLGPFAYAHPEGEKTASPEGDPPKSRAGFKAKQDAEKQAEIDGKPGSDAFKAKAEARNAKAEETLGRVRQREAAADPNAPQPDPNAGTAEPGSDEALKAIVGATTGSPDASGTREDPIDVQGDLDKAVQLLAEGKHIRLNKVDEIGTLLDKLTEMVNLAKEKGDEAPTFDLCKVSAPGTNLFCQESKGIPRAEMPQFSGAEIVPGSEADALPRNHKGEVNIENQFREKLAAMGVSITAKTVQAQHLKASQIELDGPKVAGMSKAMEAGKIPDAPIFVTKDGYVIDGHHRWAAKVALDAADGELGSITMPVEELDMEIGAALAFANEFALTMGIKAKGLGAAAEGIKEKVAASGLNPAIMKLIALAQGR